MKAQTVDTRADWAAALEGIYESTASDTEWASNVVESIRPLVPRSLFVRSYDAAYDAEGRIIEILSATNSTIRDQLRMMMEWDPAYARQFHFCPPVGTAREHAQLLDPAGTDQFLQTIEHAGFRDAVGLVVHPRPGVVTVLTAGFEHAVELTRAEREHLTRVALHLEVGQRVRMNDAAIIAEVDAKGRVETPSVGEHVARIAEARSKENRRTPEGLELWTALLEGRMSVVPRGRRYLVLDNPTPSHRMRALTRSESAVLSLAARGSSSKQISYALGFYAPHVSTLLRSAAAKVGAVSRSDLIRLAALLTRDPKGLLDDPALTVAETEILELLERGLANEQIAAIRMRSVHTIANQVASLLRKTGTSSRRQLMARPSRA